MLNVETTSDFSKSFESSHDITSKKQGKYELNRQYLQDTRYMNKLIQSLPITSSGVLTLRYLVECHQDFGKINPSIDEISEVVKFKTRNSTTRTLNHLAEEGLLIIQSNFERVSGKTTYRQTTNSYEMTSLLEKYYDMALVEKELKTLEKDIRCTRRKRNKIKLEEKKNEILERLADADHACTELKKEICKKNLEVPSLLEPKGEEKEVAVKNEERSIEKKEEKPTEKKKEILKEVKPPKETSPQEKQASSQKSFKLKDSRLAPYTIIDYANIPLSPQETEKNFKEKLDSSSRGELVGKKKERVSTVVEGKPCGKKKKFLDIVLAEDPFIRQEIQTCMLRDSANGTDLKDIIAKIKSKEDLLRYREQGLRGLFET